MLQVLLTLPGIGDADEQLFILRPEHINKPLAQPFIRMLEPITAAIHNIELAVTKARHGASVLEDIVDCLLRIHDFYVAYELLYDLAVTDLYELDQVKQLAMDHSQYGS